MKMITKPRLERGIGFYYPFSLRIDDVFKTAEIIADVKNCEIPYFRTKVKFTNSFINKVCVDLFKNRFFVPINNRRMYNEIGIYQEPKRKSDDGSREFCAHIEEIPEIVDNKIYEINKDYYIVNDDHNFQKAINCAIKDISKECIEKGINYNHRYVGISKWKETLSYLYVRFTYESFSDNLSIYDTLSRCEFSMKNMT